MELDERGVNNLVVGIIECAIKDYEKNRLKQELCKRGILTFKTPDKEQCALAQMEYYINASLRFLYSDWMDTLCSVDPDVIVEKLEKRIAVAVRKYEKRKEKKHEKRNDVQK